MLACMNYQLRVYPCLLGLLVLGGCVISPKASVPDVPVETLKEPLYRNSGYSQKSSPKTSRFSKKATGKQLNDAVYQKLIAQYHEWKGVPYKLGGMNKRGVDCSGFIYDTFRSKLGVDIPRSTELQSQVGKTIKKSQLRTGDLVFFKTGFNVRHVGVYLDDGEFMHASTSRGVMISNLANVYWKAKYWKSIRIPL